MNRTTNEPVHIVFCADRRVLPGLHVAAYSLLESISPQTAEVRFFVFSDDLDEYDMALLRQTLTPLKKSFLVNLRRVDASMFAGFIPVNGSLAAYYRLIVPQVLEAQQFLYLDIDTLCQVDVSGLVALDLGEAPVGWVPEAPLAKSVDRFVAEQLGNSPSEPYFNSGVILINATEWRKQRVTERALEYVARYHPKYCDQSALNAVLHGNAVTLDERFNCIANMRKNWPALRRSRGAPLRLIHFVDYPKPWDVLGEFVHPQYKLWRRVLDKTAMKGFRSWHATPTRKLPQTRKAWSGYKKALKDRMLFIGYSSGWLKQVKGVPEGVLGLTS